MYKYEFDVIIEIQKGSKIKYEIDPVTNDLRVDRVLQCAYVYPCNYGYINNTLAEDGDPIDVLVLGDYALQPKSIIRCRIIGGLDTYDGEINDETMNHDPKIVMVPVNSVDMSFAEVLEISETDEYIIEDFFRNYKNNEKNKKVKIGEWFCKDEALMIIMEGINNFNVKEQY